MSSFTWWGIHKQKYLSFAKINIYEQSGIPRVLELFVFSICLHIWNIPQRNIKIDKAKVPGPVPVRGVNTTNPKAIMKMKTIPTCLMLLWFSWLTLCVLQGLLSNLILGKDVLTDWQIYPLDIDGAIARGWPHSYSHNFSPASQRDASVGPALYTGTLQPNGLTWDTFLKLNEWTKVMLIFFDGGHLKEMLHP